MMQKPSKDTFCALDALTITTAILTLMRPTEYSIKKFIFTLMPIKQYIAVIKWGRKIYKKQSRILVPENRIWTSETSFLISGQDLSLWGQDLILWGQDLGFWG